MKIKCKKCGYKIRGKNHEQGNHHNSGPKPKGKHAHKH